MKGVEGACSQSKLIRVISEILTSLVLANPGIIRIL